MPRLSINSECGLRTPRAIWSPEAAATQVSVSSTLVGSRNAHLLRRERRLREQCVAQVLVPDRVVEAVGAHLVQRPLDRPAVAVNSIHAAGQPGAVRAGGAVNQQRALRIIQDDAANLIALLGRAAAVARERHI